MNAAPTLDQPREQRRRFTPRRVIAVLLVGLLFTAVTVLGIKLKRYRTAYDAIIAAGGKLEFHGPDWARNFSEDSPLPYIDTVTTVTLQDCGQSPETCTEIIRHLEQFPGLTSLNFAGNDVPDSAAGDFARIGLQLESLDLSRTNIGDDVAANIRHMRKLRVLDLSNTRITDVAATSIAGLTSLRQLNLDHTAISNNGISQFHTLTRLQELNVADTDVMEEGVAKLKAALPGAEIYDD